MCVCLYFHRLLQQRTAGKTHSSTQIFLSLLTSSDFGFQLVIHESLCALTCTPVGSVCLLLSLFHSICCSRKEVFLKNKDFFRRNAVLIINKMLELSSKLYSSLVDEVRQLANNTKKSPICDFTDVASQFRFFTPSSSSGR